jgi:hypothetical protein
MEVVGSIKVIASESLLGAGFSHLILAGQYPGPKSGDRTVIGSCAGKNHR